MDFTSGYKLKKPGSNSGGSSLEGQTAACVTELMNAATSFHKMHLKITAICT